LIQAASPRNRDRAPLPQIAGIGVRRVGRRAFFCIEFAYAVQTTAAISGHG